MSERFSRCGPIVSGCPAERARREKSLNTTAPWRSSLWTMTAESRWSISIATPLVGAARELREEAGLQAETWQVLVDLNSSPGFSDESVRVFLATGLTDVDPPEAHDEEADMTMEWYPLAEAVQRIFRGEIVNSLAVAGI
jgi:hypothetical protein